MNSQPTSISPETLAHHGEFVRSLARQLLADEHAADDVAQEAWLRYAARPPRSALDPRGWFAIVVRNLAHNQRRSQRVRAEHEARAARPEATPPVDGDLAQASALRSVVDAVLALDEPYRSTVLARYFRGSEPSRIASETNVPLATVKSRLQRAHAQLRERLDREHGSRANWALALGHLAGLEGAATGAIGALSAVKTLGIAAIVLVVAAIAWRQIAAPDEALPNSLAASAGAPSNADTPAQVETPIDERREPDAAPPATLAPTFRVAGNVRDLAYEPLALAGGPASGVALELKLVSQPIFGGDLVASANVTTDDQGDFAAELAPPDKRPFWLRVSAVRTAERRGLHLEEQIVEGVNAREGLEFARAAHGLVSGIVVDADATPVPGARISVRSSFEDSSRHELTANERGELSAPYRGYVESVQVLDEGSVLKHFDAPELLDSGGAAGLRVVVGRATALQVRVVDALGAGIEGMSVAVELDESERRQIGAAERWDGPQKAGETDADGRVVLEHVWADSKLRLTIGSDNEAHQTSSARGGELVFDGTFAAPIVATVGEQRELVARWRGDLRIVGTTRSPKGDPLGDVTLEITRVRTGVHPDYVAPMARLRSSADGTFEVRLRPREREAPLRVVAAERKSPAVALSGLGYVGGGGPTDGAVGSVELDPRGAVEGVLRADIVLEPTLTIAGRLLDAEGRAIERAGLGGFRMWVAPSGTSSHREVGVGLGKPASTLGTDGNFLVFGLTRGEWDLYVSQEIQSFYTWESFVHEFRGFPAGAQGVELRLPRVGEVRIRVRLNGGAPNETTLLHGVLFPRERERAKELAPRALRVGDVSGWPQGAVFGFSGISGESNELGTSSYGFYGLEAQTDHALQPMGPGWYVIGVHPSSSDGKRWFPQATRCLWFEPGEYVIDFDLVPTAELTGRVLGDARSQHLAVELRTLDGARIPLESLPGYGRPKFVLETDARGRFVVRNAPVGTFLLRAGAVDELARGEFRGELRVEVVDGANAQLEVTLR